jgi:membrane protein YdbS with pleckstrin-like domain
MNVSHQQQASPSVFELVGEVSDIATGACIMIVALAPLALPFLALTAVAALALLAPVVVGTLLVAPAVVAWRHCRSRGSSIGRDRARPAHR